MAEESKDPKRMMLGELPLKVIKEPPMLDELLEPFTFPQRQYLCLLARGLARSEVRNIIDRKGETIANWSNDSKFNRAVNILLDNRDCYTEKATDLFLTNLKVKAQVILENLINMGVERWEELKREDKSAVMQAIGVISHRTSSGEGKGGESYEELILRKHIALPKQNILSAPKEEKSG